MALLLVIIHSATFQSIPAPRGRISSLEAAAERVVDLVTKGMVKAPKAAFASFFTSKTGLQQSKGLEEVHREEDSLGGRG